MISLVEMQCKNWEHNRVNAGLIRQIRSAFPEEQLKLYAEKKHIEELNKLLICDGITIETEQIEFENWRSESYINRKEYKRLLENIVIDNSDVRSVVLLSSNKGIVCATSSIAKKYNNIDFYLVLHAALEEVCNNNRKTYKYIKKEFIYFCKHLKIYDISMKNCMEKCKMDNCKFIIYSPNIKYLDTKFDRSITKKIVFLHLPFGEKTGKKNIDGQDDRTVIGVYGQAVNKNAYDVIRCCCNNYDVNKVDFKVISSKESDVYSFDNVTQISPQGYLSNEELEQIIDSFDYILIPYSRKQYVVTASGIFSDAVSMKKPILMLYSPYFEYYSRYGVGLMERDVDSLAKKISEISEYSKKEFVLAEKELEKIAFEENVEILRKIL